MAAEGLAVFEAQHTLGRARELVAELPTAARAAITRLEQAIKNNNALEMYNWGGQLQEWIVSRPHKPVSPTLPHAPAGKPTALSGEAKRIAKQIAALNKK